jgi:hypothetical protein
MKEFKKELNDLFEEVIQSDDEEDKIDFIEDQNSYLDSV